MPRQCHFGNPHLVHDQVRKVQQLRVTRFPDVIHPLEHVGQIPSPAFPLLVDQNGVCVIYDSDHV
eukprot:scaffold215596_cov20-Prasinocladus_malaysianus.AAC.1